MYTIRNNVRTTCLRFGVRTPNLRLSCVHWFIVWAIDTHFIEKIYPVNLTWFLLNIKRLYLSTAASGTCTAANTAVSYQKQTKSSGKQNVKAMLPEIKETSAGSAKKAGKFS